jgi:LmbE family N-acetylglucosaminyl deacetylase
MGTSLVFSPHLDDACLSIGALLSRLATAGQVPYVYTVFAGRPRGPYSSAARSAHRKWCLRDHPVSTRRAEDRAALRSLGAIPLHGRYLDAIYRRSPDGGWLIEDVEAAASANIAVEPALHASITGTMQALISRLAPDEVLTCAAVGSHVDHRRTRDAVCAATAHSGTPVLLWEDLPYALWTARIPALPDGTTLGPMVTVSASDADRSAKYRAIQRYGSQLGMFAVGEFTVLDQLDMHAESSTADGYTERVWRVRWAAEPDGGRADG